MTWMTLREALEMAAASGFDAGEDTVGAVSLRPKKDEGHGPRQVGQGDKRHTQTKLSGPPTIGRDRRTANEVDPQLVGHAPAPLVRRSMLTVIEGGRSPEGRDNEAPTYRCSPRRNKAREFLKLVV